MLSCTLVMAMAMALAAEPSQREIQGTERLVEEYLEELEAPTPTDLRYVPTPKLSQAFPGYLFVTARFVNIPADELPKPLTERNIFAISPTGEVKSLATPEDVLELFAKAFQPIKSADDAKKAAEAALGLEQAKYPDQPFATPPDGIQAKPSPNGGYDVTAGSQPTAPPSGGPPNGMGPITVNLKVGPKGRPASVVTNNNYQPPPRRSRPVTPADIQGDQPAAQQAAGGPVTNINSPTINKALPGNTFFTPTPAKAGGKSPNKAPVVAVNPDGKTNKIQGIGQLGVYTRQQFGPVKTIPDARALMESFLTLATGHFPNVKFDSVKDSDIKVQKTSNGGIEVMGRVYVTGDMSKFFMADWIFGPRGKLTNGQRLAQGLRD